jgi:hypothetical protein
MRIPERSLAGALASRSVKAARVHGPRRRRQRERGCAGWKSDDLDLKA